VQVTSTALTTSAMVLLNEVSPAETLSDDELADGLQHTNEILETLAVEQSTIPYLTHETFPMIGAASYTIGGALNTVGGTLASTRPLRILAASTVDIAGASHPVRLVTAAEWEALPDRTRTGLFAEVLFSDGGFPMNTWYLSPKPAAGSLVTDSLKLLTAFPDLITAIELAPGYLNYLRHLLAAILAPEYGRDPSIVAGGLALAKAAVITLNAQTLGPVSPESMQATGAGQPQQQQQAA
jgi:hypothetical protein